MYETFDITQKIVTSLGLGSQEPKGYYTIVPPRIQCWLKNFAAREQKLTTWLTAQDTFLKNISKLDVNSYVKPIARFLITLADQTHKYDISTT